MPFSKAVNCCCVMAIGAAAATAAPAALALLLLPPDIVIGSILLLCLFVVDYFCFRFLRITKVVMCINEYKQFTTSQLCQNLIGNSTRNFSLIIIHSLVFAVPVRPERYAILVLFLSG